VNLSKNIMRDPLTPADCDLHENPFMPPDFVRLRGSSMVMRASGEDFRCAVLWCDSWQLGSRL
jgi:hypothetical protein